MNRPQKETIWPFLCILACLFVLSVAAPRAWDRAARSRAVTELSLSGTPQLQSQEEESPIPSTAQPYFAPTLSAAPQASISMGPREAPQAVYAQPSAKVAGGPVTTQELSDPSIEDLAQEEDHCPAPSQPFLETIEDPRQETSPKVTLTLDLKSSRGGDLTPTPAAASAPVAAAGAKPAIEVSIVNPAPESSKWDAAPLPSTSIQPLATPNAPVSAQAATKSKTLASEQLAGSPRLASLQRLPAFDRSMPVRPAPAVKPCWQASESLRMRLQKLSANENTAPWAAEAQRWLDKLGPAASQDSREVRTIFAELGKLIARVEPLADGLSTPHLATELRRTAHALSRRIELWNQALAAEGLDLTPTALPKPDPQQLGVCLANLEFAHDDSREARAWQQFLLLDGLAHGTSSEQANEQEIRQLAKTALARLSMPMTPEQREVVTTEPMTALAMELRRWAAEPVDLAQMLESVEQFERTGLPSAARQAAEDCRRLSVSPMAAEREVGDRLEMLYRNANLRIAFTQALVNRLVPVREPEYEPVNDTILGLPVEGRSVNSSDLSVRFIPDPQRLLMCFEVRGSVTALTSSSAGPATFFHDSHARYEARRPMEIEAQGIRLDETEVNVVNHTRLRALRTKFDSLPIFGSVARDMARAQQEEQAPAANREAEEKVAARCRQRIDQESYARLNSAVGQMREHLFAPLADLKLSPTLIGGATAEDRMAMRLRLAASRQLGSDTPRPRAPSDSMASLQIHETALNNLIEQLDLNGRRMALPELIGYISGKLHRTATAAIDAARDDVTIAFAPKDAVYVRCTGNQITLTLAIAELAAGERSWQNFQVRVSYRPQVQGRSAELARDGVVQLIGRLSTGSQIALRGVFSKAFPKDSTFRLTPDWLLHDQRLNDLAVTQFIIDDGWIGLALGPDRAAQTTVEEKKDSSKPAHKERLAWLKQLKEKELRR